MSDILSVGVIILSAVICATMQLSSGTLLLLYHASFGAHARIKTRRLASSFIAGFGFMTFILLAAACFLLVGFLTPTVITKYLCVLVAVLFLAAFIVWCFYYRRSYGTKLWLPKPVAKHIAERAKVASSTTETFSLGALSSIAELPFTFSLILASAYSILRLPQEFQILAVAFYSIIIVLPLLVIRGSIRNGKNIAEIQRWRARNKTFFRIFAGIGFFVLALFILSFGVLGVYS